MYFIKRDSVAVALMCTYTLYGLKKFGRGGGIGFRIDGFVLKSAVVVDFCGKSSGFADSENTVDRGSAAKFGADSGLCLS